MLNEILKNIKKYNTKPKIENILLLLTMVLNDMYLYQLMNINYYFLKIVLLSDK